MNQDNEYYLKLLSLCDSIREFCRNSPKHPSFLTFKPINEKCYVEMYDELGEVVPRHSLFERIDSLEETCADCWKFYLSPRNNSVKSLDIKMGKQFESTLREYFTMLGIPSERADTDLKNSPDNLLKGVRDEVVAYYEVKYLSAPFVKVFQKVRGRECYEGSNTLDVGKKIERQRQIVADLGKPVFYLYWLDYPCIKGLFYMDAQDVYQYIDEVSVEWNRRERSGDYVGEGSKRVKVGHTKRVYLPLHRMKPFSQLIDRIGELRRQP